MRSPRHLTTSGQTEGDKSQHPAVFLCNGYDGHGGEGLSVIGVYDMATL